MSLEDARKIAPDIPVRIAGLRYWVFVPAIVFAAVTCFNYTLYLKAKRIVTGYRVDCSNLSTATSGICYEIPAAYKFDTTSSSSDAQLLEITPEHQTVYNVTASPGSLPQSGSGNAIFWKGQLTALATPAGQIETNFSPVHQIQRQETPIFCWFLMAFGAACLPFIRGFAFIIEPDVDDELKPRNDDFTA